MNEIKNAIRWLVSTAAFCTLGGLLSITVLNKVFDSDNLDGYFIVYVIAMVMVDLRDWVVRHNNKEDTSCDNKS